MFREMRRAGQAVPEETCLGILEEEKRGVLAVLGDDEYPYAVPLDYYFDPDEGKIYFHCAKAGHKSDAMKAHDKVCFTVWGREYREEGDWAYYVTSVVVMGRARPVEDRETALSIAKRFGLKYYPDEASVDAEIERAFHRMQIIEITPEHMTGKLVHEK